MELAFAPPDRAKAFQCSSCPEATQKLRRCRDPREDFTYKDNSGVFPIMVTKEGEQFSFCPGKATWDATVTRMFQTLVISAETGNLWDEGGISNQPAWFAELLSMFLTRYSDYKFYSRARSILGDSNSVPKKPVQTPRTR